MKKSIILALDDEELVNLSRILQDKGAKEAGITRVADLTKEQVKKIARTKFGTDDEAAISQVTGTARSMGITVGQGEVTDEEKKKYEQIEKEKEEELAAKEAAHAAAEGGAAKPGEAEEKPAGEEEPKEEAAAKPEEKKEEK